jgi:ankyrin repeat protein
VSHPSDEPALAPASLPDDANLDWLRKQAKRLLPALRNQNPEAKLADAQFALAKQYGFKSWRALKAHVDSLTIDGTLVEAARNGDAAELARLLDLHPDRLHLKSGKYDWSLLHFAARHAPAIALLLRRGLDANTLESGDNTTAMHWAAAAGALDSVRLLADAGCDVVGHGDDHELEVIGWAACWEGCDTRAHRDVADFLVSRGARHHIFSAIAHGLEDEVRRIVAADPSALNRRMSRNESHQLPLHFAVRMRQKSMVDLLIALGADPLGVDDSGSTATANAFSGDLDHAPLQAIHAMTLAELDSARRGHREARLGPLDLVAALALGDLATAERAWDAASARTGALHLMAKRGDVRAVQWLLDLGADPNERWTHWGMSCTALHLAIWGDHEEVVRLLLDRGADASIRDSMHDGDASGWAEHFGRARMIAMLVAHVEKSPDGGGGL